VNFGRDWKKLGGMHRYIRLVGFAGGLMACSATAPERRQTRTEITRSTLRVPTLSGPWIRLVGNPDLGPWSDPGAQPVDFSIWQAADGSWQLVACVRKTRFPGQGRLFYRWESPSLVKPDWAEKGVFLTTDAHPEFEQGHLQAPHVLKDNDTYHIFFNSGGSAFVWTSRDGKSFEPSESGVGTASLFAMGRDVMVFDNRTRDGLLYAYYTAVVPGAHPGRQDHTIAYRTASKLPGPWSEPVDVSVLTPNTPGSPYNFINAESPFVVFRDGTYYRWEQMNVHASASPTAWVDGPVARLTGDDPRAFYAPEIIEFDGQTFIAGYKYKNERAGIYLAPFVFVQRE
jgi:hypothetical protein